MLSGAKRCGQRSSKAAGAPALLPIEVANQQESASVAQHSLALSRRSFPVGNSGLLQVLDPERLYQHANTNPVLAQTRQYLNIVRLYVATAGGWVRQDTVNPS